MSKKFKCIKGLATDHFVVCMQNDIVELYSVDENEIVVKGIFGWISGVEINFTAKEFVNHFCVWMPEPVTIG
jgi:hypothetical protein